MAHFAEIDENNIVTRVVVIANEKCNGGSFPDSEEPGVAFCKKLYGQHTNWKQTSYNENFRERFAGFGMFYDEDLDKFYYKEEE